MPRIIRLAIGAMKDSTSISLARLSSGSPLEVAVLKATSHGELPVDDRYHVQVHLLASSSPSHAAACVHALSRRLSRTSNWIVALKSLAVAFHLLRHGNSMIVKEMTVSQCSRRLLDLSTFRDASADSYSWDYTVFVQGVAGYLDARLYSAVLGKLRNLGHRAVVAARIFTDMKIQSILDHIIHWQKLLDRAAFTRPTDAVKSNRLVQISLYMVVSETFVLYRDISSGLSLLLDNFFRLPRPTCLKTFEACARAREQFDELEYFYEMCKEIGVGRKSEYPRVQKISRVLLDELDEFLNPTSSVAALPDDDRKSPPELLSSSSVLQRKSFDQKTLRGGWRSMGGATKCDFESVVPSACSELRQRQEISSSGNRDDGGVHHEITCAEAKVHDPDASGGHRKAASELILIDGWEDLLSASVDDVLLEEGNQKPSESLESPALANARQNSYLNPFLQEEARSMSMQLQQTFYVIEASEQGAYDPEKSPFLASLQAPSTSKTHAGDDLLSQQVLYEQNLWMQGQNEIISKRIIC